MKHVQPEVRAVLVARLRVKRAGGESVTADVRRGAAALLVQERTVWRWLESEPSADPVTDDAPRCEFGATS